MQIPVIAPCPKCGADLSFRDAELVRTGVEECPNADPSPFGEELSDEELAFNGLRDHVRRLSAQGMGQKRIADVMKMSVKVVRSFLKGDD